MRARFGISTLLILFMLAACGSPEDHAAKYLARGNRLLAQSELEKARIEYKNAARILPSDPEVYYRLGLVDEAQQDIGAAYGEFLHAEQQDLHFAPAVLKLASYDIAGGEPGEAAKRVDRILADAPGQPEARALHAALLLRQKDFPATESEALFAQSKDPGNITAISVLTGLYLAEGDQQKAQAAIDTGVARVPGNVPLLLLKAQVYQRAGNMEKVDEAYQTIFRLKPDVMQFRLDLANLYIQAGDLDAAESVLRAAIATRPNDFELKHQLVRFLGDHRSVAEAESEIHAEMKAYPQNDDLYFWLADLYATHNAVDKAVALLQQVVKRAPEQDAGLNARTTLARIDFIRGDKSLAETLVNTVLAQTPDNRDALFVRANLEFDQGAYETAVSDLRTILQTHPNDPEALRMLAETLLKQGYPDLATDTMGQLVEAAPDNLEAQVRLAQLYDYQKNDARALDILQAVTKTDPNYAVAWESTARVAIDANNIPLAESAIHTLAKLPGQQMTANFLSGQIETKAGNNQAAAGTYTRIIDNDSASPLAEHALAALADTNASAGRLDDTIAYLEALKSKTAYTDTLLGESYIRQGKPDQAKAALDRALAHSPTDQKPFLDEAALYVKAHQPDQALEVLKRGTEAIPGDIRAPMMQADILNQLGRYAEAIAVYQAVLKRSPGLAVAANNLGALIADYQYTDKASLQGAIDLMQKFSQADRPELLDTLAWLYYRQGNSEAALATIEREATFLKDASPEMHYHIGAIYLKNGKPADAKRELQLATATDAKYPGLDDAKSMLAGL